MSFKNKFNDTISLVQLKVEHANARLNPHSPDYFAPSTHAESARVYADIFTTVTVTDDHKEIWTHQLIAHAAGFASVYALEAHLRATHHEPSHEGTLLLLEEISASEVDKLVAHKEIFWIDAHKARRNAARQAHHIAHSRYKHATSFGVARDSEGPVAHYKHGTSAPYRVEHVLDDPTILDTLAAEEKLHHYHWHSH